MTTPTLDRERLRELFDLRSSYNVYTGGTYHDDPYPAWHRLREQGPVLPGTLHELTGCSDPYFFHGLPYPDRPHFTVFDYDTCMTAYRNPEVFASSADPVDVNNGPLGVTNSMLSMGGTQHKRYRALVQPSFLPANGRWWIENWIAETVNLLIDGLAHDGRAELNVDFFAAIPLLTITGSFGVPVEQALEIRQAIGHDPQKVVDLVKPIVTARRKQPQDDLISILVKAELADDDGENHQSDGSGDRLFRAPVARGRLGYHLEADGHHAHRPAAAPGSPRSGACRPAVAALRHRGGAPVDADRSDVLPLGDRRRRTGRGRGARRVRRAPRAGAANRDPSRWDRPDEYDITRKFKPSLRSGKGSTSVWACTWRARR